MGTIHEDEYTFLIVSCSFLLRMRNISEKFRRNQNIFCVPLLFFFFRKSCCLWECEKIL